MDSPLSIFKALSDRNRLRIVAALMEYEELCACQIIELLQVTGATTSRHLSQLVNAGLLQSRKEGRWIHYRLQNNSFYSKVVNNWLKDELQKSEDYSNDLEKLSDIMQCSREELCRKQQGEKCCPVNK